MVNVTELRIKLQKLEEEGHGDKPVVTHIPSKWNPVNAVKDASLSEVSLLRHSELSTMMVMIRHEPISARELLALVK